MKKLIISISKLGLKIAPIIGLSVSALGSGTIAWQIWQGQLQYRDVTRRISELRQNQHQDNSATASSLVVSVMGAVAQPQVVQLPPGARIADAITAAGGIATDSAMSTFFQSLNLAEKVTDGQQIIVPPKSSETASDTLDSTTSPKLNLNTASEKQLEEVPGMGEVRVQKLVELRPFTSWEDFNTKLKFPESVVNNLKKISDIY